MMVRWRWIVTVKWTLSGEPEPATPHHISTMSAADRISDPTGGDDDGESGQDSDVVDWNTLVISMELCTLLQNPDAAEWDSGTVVLDDGRQMQLWSEHSPAPTSLPNESLLDFTARQRLARTERIEILANRAERIHAARKTHRESQQQPWTSRSNSVIEADCLEKEKQSLLNRLANRIVENATDPKDAQMFDFIDRSEGEAHCFQLN